MKSYILKYFLHKKTVCAVVLSLALPSLGYTQAPRWVEQMQALGEAHKTVLDLSPMEQAAVLEKLLTAYRNGDLPGGDTLRKSLKDPDGNILAEWYAIRRGLPMGYGRIKKFFDTYPAWPKSRLVNQRIERAFLESSVSPRDLVVFFKSNPPITNGAKMAFAEALQAEGYTEEAKTVLKNTWRSGKLDTTTEAYIISMRPPVLTTEDHKVRMERFLFAGDWRSATNAANYIDEGYDTLVEARRLVMENNKGAQQALAQVPEKLRREPAYVFSLVRYFRLQKKYKEAIAALTQLPKDTQLTDGDRWWDERERLARAMVDQREYHGAYQVASQHGAESAAERLDGEFLAGWIALRFLKKPEVAAIHFAEAAKIGITPISTARAAYWRGRAAEASGKSHDAFGFYQEAANVPVAYYGQLARKKLSLPIGQVRALPYVLSDEDIQRVASMPSFRALKAAGRTGNDALVMLLGADIAASLDNLPDMDALATLAFDGDNPRLAMLIGKTAYQKGLPLDYHAYPVGGIPEFEQKGPEIDPALVYAISRQESAFDAKARSGAGARGLMQLMPGTAKETATRLKLAYDVEQLTEDPAYNATLGSAYLGALIKQWNGSHALAFASYNAGAGNVRKWITAYGDPRRSEYELIDWIERIPFPETRNYVQRVIENYYVYKFLLQNPQKMEQPQVQSTNPSTLSLRSGIVQ